uniref:Uncharacterized protein n=1 Tax=Brassica oleracea var. oleracea TaxID=109376 RepID=A0A0D3BV64_BRAOL
MSSRSKTSNKSHCDHFASDGSSSQHENVVPKVEFTEHPIDPEEVKKYWAAMGHVEFPTPGICHPRPVDNCPSRSCPNGLDALRSFAEFWTIGQVSPRGLQHVVGILVLSYERGLPLDVDHLEGMLMPVGSSAIVQLSPRNNMAIIAGFVSNYHDWKNFFFYVRINNASVEESCIPILRTTWGRKVTNPFPPTPNGLCTFRDLLRGGEFYWASFTPKRVHHAVVLHRSRFQ